MPLEFHSAEHANLRLGNTIIRIKGYPVYVYGINGDYSCDLRYLGRDKLTRIKDIRVIEGIDILPVPLGFCHYGDLAMYLFRRPSRRTKQGLSEESLSTHTGRTPAIGSCGKWRHALHRTIVGEFPSITNTFKILKIQGQGSVPIHRNWAIQAGGTPALLYKFHGTVGYWDEGAKRFRLNEAFAYLQETLDEEIVYE